MDMDELILYYKLKYLEKDLKWFNNYYDNYHQKSIIYGYSNKRKINDYLLYKFMNKILTKGINNLNYKIIME
jgi:hypothetical protein